MGEGPTGYYRQPALHNDTIVFVAEGDLWKVPADGGAAVRLTTHPGEETTPAISPDGGLVAFVARYEGPTEVYTMPIDGGRPTRRTYGIDAARVTGWTPEGKVLFSTDVYSGLPNWQLATMDVSRDDVAAAVSIVPLAQAADGGYDDAGRVLFFTRLPFQGSHTKRYQGGTAQNIWRFAEGDEEATPLTADYPGTSKRPMWWRGRVYFASDRDGTMNLWSMNPDGGDLRPHTRHTGWEVKTPSLHNGRIVYQRGADLHVYDIGANRDRHWSPTSTRPGNTGSTSRSTT
jgi:tricorn protease